MQIGCCCLEKLVRLHGLKICIFCSMQRHGGCVRCLGGIGFTFIARSCSGGLIVLKTIGQPQDGVFICTFGVG
jgi:hypothetical protein